MCLYVKDLYVTFQLQQHNNTHTRRKLKCKKKKKKRKLKSNYTTLIPSRFKCVGSAAAAAGRLVRAAAVFKNFSNEK